MEDCCAVPDRYAAGDRSAVEDCSFVAPTAGSPSAATLVIRVVLKAARSAAIPSLVLIAAVEADPTVVLIAAANGLAQTVVAAVEIAAVVANLFQCPHGSVHASQLLQA